MRMDGGVNQWVQMRRRPAQHTRSRREDINSRVNSRAPEVWPWVNLHIYCAGVNLRGCQTAKAHHSSRSSSNGEQSWQRSGGSDTERSVLLNSVPFSHQGWSDLGKDRQVTLQTYKQDTRKRTPPPTGTTTPYSVRSPSTTRGNNPTPAAGSVASPRLCRCPSHDPGH